MLPNGGGDGKAFEFLTTENMKKFNEGTPDVEGVRYFSYGAEYEPGLIDTWRYGYPPNVSFPRVTFLQSRFSHSVVLEKEGPNDGLVSILSARWVGIPPTLCFTFSHDDNRARTSAHSNTSITSISWAGSTPLGTNGPNLWGTRSSSNPLRFTWGL